MLANLRESLPKMLTKLQHSGEIGEIFANAYKFV